MSKIHKKAIILVIILNVLISITLNYKPCSASVIWEDKFDNGIPYYWVMQSGTFSADNKILQTLDRGVWHSAYRNSSIAYGTWSFDIYINRTDRMYGEHLYIFLLADNMEENGQTYGYDIMIWLEPGPLSCTLWKREGDALTNLVKWGESTLSGWNHIDVIRETNGQFYILVNNKLRADPIDTTITTSNYFGFVAYGGHALDNITVNDDFLPLLTPADFRFSKDSISISNQRGSTNPITFYVYNHGQALGNATLVVGETPSGIDVTLDTEDIINLKDKDRGYSKKVTGTIDILTSAAPGVHNVILELHNKTSVCNTMNLVITVEAPEESTTTTTTTTTPPTTTEPSTPSSPSPGFEGIFIISALLVIPIFLKKRR